MKDVKMMEREFKTRQKHRLAVEFLQRGDVLSLFSLDAPCAILNRDAADVNPVNVNPVKLTLVLIRSARKKGLQVFSHTKVKSYGRQGKECVLTTEDGLQIRARRTFTCGLL